MRQSKCTARDARMRMHSPTSNPGPDVRPRLRRAEPSTHESLLGNGLPNRRTTQAGMTCQRCDARGAEEKSKPTVRTARHFSFHP